MKHLFVFSFFFTTAVLAQTPTVSDQIVVTASAVAESVESTPAAVSVITRKEMDEREARDVVDVLREVPGLSVARTGSPGKITSLFIRGGSSKQALVLWNGVEMNNAYFSAYNFGQLSTSGVEKVEIVRGPYSALYGSDAVSGVVNVLTSPARSTLRVAVEAGENDFRNGELSGALVRGSWSAHGTFEHRSDEGFAPNDDFAGDTWVAGAQASPRPNFTIGVIARRNSYDLGIPRNANADFTAFVPTLHRREEGWERQIVIPAQLQLGGFKYEIRLADNHREERFADPEGPFGAESAFTDSFTRSARGSIQSSKTSAGVITFGGEWETSEVDHTDSFGLDVRERSRDSRSLFIEDRISFALRGGTSLEIAAGARYDDFDTFGGETSPRLALALIEHDRKWRAAYGEGFRAPAIGELYAPFFGNADLHEERSKNFEAGFDQYVRGATLSVTAFRSDYDDLISFDGKTFRFGNISRAKAHGVEFGGSKRFGPLDASVSYTWLKAVDEATNEQLLRRPKNSGSLALRYHAGALSTQLVVTHSGARPDVTDLLPFGTVTNAEFTTADVTLRYELGHLIPFIRISNVLDEHYEEVFGYPSAGRRIVAGVRYAQ
jgi:vitamin B12 transporter